MTSRINRQKTAEMKSLASGWGILLTAAWVLSACSGALGAEPLDGGQGSSKGKKTYAQKLVDDAVAKHSEVTGLEMATTPPNKSVCVTIAATEAKDIGEKCDDDEFAAMRTQKPFVEKEEDGFDITMPLHDATGKMIGTVGMDFKPEPGQQESGVVERATQIMREIEGKISSKVKLFEPVE